MKHVIRGLAMAAVCALALPACKRTMENQEARYAQVKDRLDVLATKNPTLKAGVAAKMAEFETEHRAAVAKGGEEGVEAVSRLASRMEAYEKELNPTAGQPVGVTPTTVPGGKLGVAPGGNLGAPGVGSAGGPSGFGAPASGALPPGGAGFGAPPGGAGFGTPGAAPASGAGFGVPPAGGAGFGTPPGAAPASGAGFGAPAGAGKLAAPGQPGFGAPPTGAAPASGGSGFGGK